MINLSVIKEWGTLNRCRDWVFRSLERVAPSDFTRLALSAYSLYADNFLSIYCVYAVNGLSAYTLYADKKKF